MNFEEYKTLEEISSTIQNLTSLIKSNSKKDVFYVFKSLNEPLYEVDLFNRSILTYAMPFSEAFAKIWKFKDRP